LLKSAIRDDDPVLLFEDTKLWPMKGSVPTDPECLVPIGKAAVKREGTDVTVVAIAGAMRVALEAARALEADGISVELIDPRTLKPLDTDTILGSIARTGRLVLVENAHRMASITAEIAAVIAEEGLHYLKAPIKRLTAPDVHVPFSPTLEALMYPGKDGIIRAIKSIL
jgi:pyruvate dehydrogenase E1 component beta subunit